tara:strand:+ start:276 stop:506 length:231 start_codon:yes stop_codon:yes gene_type:complete
MCLFSPPKPPKLPDPPETPPKPEKTAKAPILGAKRTGRKEAGSNVSTSSPRRGLFARRRGTASLRIPLRSSGNLNY